MNRLLLLPLFMGIMLIVYSWYSSYPLSIDFLDDFIFNHVSVPYWFGLPLALGSMFLIAVTSKSSSLKWIMTVSIVITMYSLSYFYYMLPGSDSHYFRGLNEYFIKTKDLDPLKPHHLYFQWPSFFLLSNVTTSISGLGLANIEFLLYAIIGFLLASAMYIYASKAYKKWGFLAVASFFVAMFYFLNYQFVPFSLAFGLLFLLLMLETRKKSFKIILILLVLFTSISLTHAFVPLFFVLYLLVRCILNRSKQYGRLFALTLILYLVVQFTQAPFSFAENIRSVITLPTEYWVIVEETLAPVSVPIDVVAQIFSRVVTITTIIVCLTGFIILFIKGKMRNLDLAILITGAVYSALGIIFFTLGSRAISLVFIPISLGVLHFVESRFGKYVKSLLLALLILFVFIPLHTSFYDSQIFFQTKEAYQAENFMIDHYNWAKSSFILAHFRVITYLQTKQPSLAGFEDDVHHSFVQRLKEYDSIVYTIGLGKNLLKYNYTTERILCEEKMNVIYNNGFSYIAIKAEISIGATK